MAVWQWSKTPSSNATSDLTMNWQEGIAPSILNDNVRAMMARIAEWRDDTAGTLQTAGTSTAYTVTTNQGVQTPTPVNGQLLCVLPHATNGNAPTLAVDGGSAYPIQAPAGVNIAAGVMVGSSLYTLTFNASSAAWLLRNVYASPGLVPFLVPIGAMADWTGASAPNSNFVLPFGQAISRTTYSTLFNMYAAMTPSLPYGVGDGSTTFNIPDLRGRVVAGIDNMGGVPANIITTLATDNGTIVGTTPGSKGGSQAHTQASGEAGQHNHGISEGGGHSHGFSEPVVWDNSGGNNAAAGGNFVAAVEHGTLTATNNATTGLSINNNSAPSAMAWLQPTIMLNKILRII